MEGVLLFTRLGECLVNCCGAEVGLRSPQLCMLLGFLEQLGGLAEGSAGAEAVLELCERQVAVRSDAGAGVAVAVVCAAGASAPAGAMRARHVLQSFLGYHAAPVVAAVVRRDAAERSARMNEYTANNAIGLGPAAAEDCLGGETHFHRFEAAILRPLLREPACEEAWLRPVLDASGRTLCCYVVEEERHVRLRLLRGRETDRERARERDRERDGVGDYAARGVIGAAIDGHLEGYGSLWGAVLACCGSCGGAQLGSAPPVRNGAGGNGGDNGTEVVAMAAAATKTHLCGTGMDEVCVVAACVTLTEPKLCVVAICKGGDRTTATAEHAAVAAACEAAARAVQCAFEPSASAPARAPANALSVHDSGEAAAVDRGHAAAVAAAPLPQQCMGAADHPGVLPGSPIVVELAGAEEATEASSRASSHASGHANFNANGAAATDVLRQMATSHQSVNLKDAEARGAHSAVAAAQSPVPTSSSVSVPASALASPAASSAASAIISPPSCPSTPSTPSAPASLETTTNRTGSPDPSTPGPSSDNRVLEKRGNETHGSPSMNDSSHHDLSAVTMPGQLSPAVLPSMPPPMAPMGHAAKLVSLQSRVPTTPTGDRPPKAFTRRHHHGAVAGGGKANGTRDAGEAEEQGGSGSGSGGAHGAKALPPGGLYSPMPKGT